MSKQSPYLKLETQIAKDELGGIMDRWRYGQKLLKEKGGFRKLADGRITELIVEATRAGLVISRREIQYRMKCAAVYEDDRLLRSAAAQWGSWRALCDANFPSVEVDESDEVDAIEEVGLSASEDDWRQDPLFDIPGFKAVLQINGKKRDLPDITVGEAIEYRDMCQKMHANFGRTVAQIEASVAAMLAGSGGDLDANALEAWKRATEKPEG